MIRAILKSVCCDTIEASDGQQAFHLLRNEHPASKEENGCRRSALCAESMGGADTLSRRWRSGNRQGASERANRDIALGIMQGRTMPHRMAPSHRLGQACFSPDTRHCGTTSAADTLPVALPPPAEPLRRSAATPASSTTTTKAMAARPPDNCWTSTACR